MALGRPTKKVFFVCTVLAMLVCCLPPALFLGSMTPFISSHADNNDGPDSRGTSLPQRWGIRKTTVPALRLLSGLQLQTAAIVPHKSVLSERCANGVFAVFYAQLPVSGLAYLNNLTIRC